MNRIFLNAISSVALALAIGVVLSTPLLLCEGLSIDYKLQAEFGVLPDSDEFLWQWYSSRGVDQLRISRDNHIVIVEYRRRSIFGDALWPSWEGLGYKKTISALISRSIRLSNTSHMLSVMIIASQIGFLTVSLIKLRNRRARSKVNVHLRQPGASLSISAGVLIGIIFPLLGIAYSYIIRSLVTSSDDLYGRWKIVNEFGVVGKFSVVVLGVVIAPICEEVFFRGVLFRSFADQGHELAGHIISSMLFAAVHFSAQNIIIYLAYGLALSWAYRKTQSLITPIIAHSINNAVAFTILLLRN